PGRQSAVHAAADRRAAAVAASLRHVRSTRRAAHVQGWCALRAPGPLGRSLQGAYAASPAPADVGCRARHRSRVSGELMANETRLAARPAPGERSRSTRIPDDLSRRVVVERIEPQIDRGRFPIKRPVGETVDVSATIFADGHDMLTAVLRDRPQHRQRVGIGGWGLEGVDKTVESPIPNPQSPIPSGGQQEWRETPMSMIAPGTDRWTARFDVSENGWHEYQIVAWPDPFLTWRRDLRVKWGAGQDVSVELIEGSALIRETARRAIDGDAGWLLDRADQLTGSTPQADRIAAGLGADLVAVVARYADRSRATESAALRVWVDRV